MPDEPKVKRIDIREFREFGYLQELNRGFLHPLGLALEVVVDDDGTETLGGIWDYRDDPEGMAYAEGVMDPLKTERVQAANRARFAERVDALGYWQQPAPDRETTSSE